MRLRIFSIAFCVIASCASGQLSNPLLEQATKSPLWRILTPKEYSAGWGVIAKQDPNVVSWNIKDFQRYIQARADDLDDKISQTKKFEHDELAKIKGRSPEAVAKTAKVFMESRRRFWTGVTTYPTVLDFVAAGRLIDGNSGRAELVRLIDLFDAVAAMHSSREADQREARFIFIERCRKGMPDIKRTQHSIQGSDGIGSGRAFPK